MPFWDAKLIAQTLLRWAEDWEEINNLKLFLKVLAIKLENMKITKILACFKLSFVIIV